MLVPWVLCAVFVQCTYLHDGVSASDIAPDGPVRSCVDVRTEAEPAVRSTLASARLTVYVSPSGNVWINGTARGTAPLRNVTLKPGRYEVSAGQGSPTETRMIHLRAGQRRTLRFDLTPGE